MGRKRKASTSEADDENTSNNQLPASKRYRLRSGNVGALPSSTDKDAVRKKSAGDLKQTKAKRTPPPFIEYKGRVEYYTEMADISAACETLLNWVNAQEGDTIIPIAFDMEWPFSFQTGSGRSAVIQLCADLDLCYVLHISKLTELPATLLDLLYHKRVCLHGICVKNDCRKLERDYADAGLSLYYDRAQRTTFLAAYYRTTSFVHVLPFVLPI